MLLAHINEGKRVVIDITAAKKSMVAGAYLFAAFADVPVSYVDFETYDPAERRPYGYTCIIDEMESPTKAFRLRDWERVSQLYQHCAFRSAKALLIDELIPAMKERFEGDEKELFEPDEIAAAEDLVKALEVFQYWDEADFSGAYRKFLRSKLPNLPLPTAIPELGMNKYWAEGQTFAALQREVDALEHGTGGEVNASLYLQHKKLLTYVYDELSKIERLRLRSEDFRSALLRAAGLSEFLVKARLIRLWHQDQLFLEGRPRSEISATQADADLAKFVGLNQMVQILQGKEKELNSYPEGKLSLKAAPGAPLMDTFWSGATLKPVELANLRNAASRRICVVRA